MLDNSVFENRDIEHLFKTDYRHHAESDQSPQPLHKPYLVQSNILHDHNAGLGNLYEILLKRKWLILLCTLAILIPAVAWLAYVTPVYQTEATIIYEEANDTAILLDFGQPFYSKSAILNMVEQIKSRSLAEQVIDMLPSNIIATFKFPKNIRDKASRKKYIVGLISKDLEVQNIRGADIIKIRVKANDANAVKYIADRYVDLIVDSNLQKKKKEISNIRNFVEIQLSILQTKLKKAEEDLLDFKEKHDLVQLSEASTKMVTSVTDVEVSYNQARTEREALEQRKRFIDQKKQELLPSLVVPNNTSTQQLKIALMNLEKQYASLMAQPQEADPSQIAQLKDRIVQSKQDLINELLKNGVRENLADPLSQIRNLLQESITMEVDLETYKAKESGLKKTLDKYNAELQLLPKQELDLARLVRAKEVNDKIFATLLEKREEARITEAGKVGDVQVIDYAEEPPRPVSPQKMKTLFMAIVLGLSFGIGMSLILNSLDNSLKTEQDIEKYLDLPVMAAIPQIFTNGVLQRMAQKEDPNDSIQSKMLSQILSKSHIFEAYRSLQLNLSFLRPDQQIKSLLITSSTPREGKTTTAINIAQFYARGGTKTLLIDCDLRRPMIHKSLKLNQEPGLTNILIDKFAILHNTVQFLPDTALNEKLAILTSGSVPPNPSELVGSKRMEEILQEAYSNYDLIVIDSPPVISATDAILLGKRVDTVLLVLRSGKTSSDAAMKAKHIFENSKIYIAGTILNAVDLRNTCRYYKDYYYYSSKN